MRLLKTWWLLIVLFFLSGCVNNSVPDDRTVADNGDIACPVDVGTFCIEIYQPVCGDDDVTYSNSCKACQTVERYREGACE